ncbi:RusA family crossover junction endodeoxyribonuclease [Streptomyces hydrogenans]|uniref:RusA family crossover junction endodeoxyribonuclease n=1 Tax=Streptomyces hydrogenans TaxID=1873719 RepID=UPI0036A1EC79
MHPPALTLAVRGTPGPQGSKSHKGGGRMVESSAKVKPWREAVRHAAVIAVEATPGWQRLDGPLRLDVVFFFDRPKSHFGTGRNADVLKASAPATPIAAPDLSKLIRSTEDAITDSGAWHDDSRVAVVTAAKRWVHDPYDPFGVLDSPGALDTPGALIRIWHLATPHQETTP